VLTVLAVLWFVGAGVLTILMSSPSIRYIDTSNILVAPIFVYWAALLALPPVEARASVDTAP